MIVELIWSSIVNCELSNCWSIIIKIEFVIAL